MTRERTQVPSQECWNVEAFYPTLNDWKEELARIQGGGECSPRWPLLKAYQGRLNESPEVIAQFFDLFFDLERKLNKLSTYAHLRLDEDLGNDDLKKNFGLISSLFHEFQIEYSWVEPEMLSLSAEKFAELMRSPSLKSYRFYLEKLGRMKPHVLSSELEGLLALSGRATETSYKTFSALNHADLKFKPAQNEKGEDCELTQGTYLLYLRSNDRTLRKSAFENLHSSYKEFENTFCELLQGQIQNHFFLATARKYNNCLEAALYPHRIDPIVYTNLLEAVEDHLPALHKYLQFRKKALNLTELHPYDLYVPLVEESQVYTSYPDACDLVIKSVAPLGEHYQQILSEGLLQDRWVDPFENLRKRSGAYSSGCYDSMPYILMNYQGTLNDILTLAHEAGHSMHTYLSAKTQPYVDSHYPIFVAEVASTLNEQLLLRYLKSRCKDKKERAYLINYEIEAIRTTLFRQALFSEFELQLHKLIEQKIPLTPILLRETYVKLNQKYYGSDLVLDSSLQIEWARIPHFYYNFYVYQYATGLSAALSLVEGVQASEAARDVYIKFLSSGGSQYPLDLLQIAGVNLKEPTAVHQALDRFSVLLKELEECL